MGKNKNNKVFSFWGGGGWKKMLDLCFCHNDPNILTFTCKIYLEEI